VRSVTAEKTAGQTAREIDRRKPASDLNKQFAFKEEKGISQRKKPVVVQEERPRIQKRQARHENQHTRYPEKTKPCRSNEKEKAIRKPGLNGRRVEGDCGRLSGVGRKFESGGNKGRLKTRTDKVRRSTNLRNRCAKFYT